jgi:NAD-dependent dihydropyrimidine dehydrogenase PreA subunit
MTWIDTVAGELRKCTDCGLCLAACPTFAASRAEGDSPRGRIHLIASLLAGESVDPVASTHLSGCIECSACYTPCPTGVRFAAARQAHRVATDSLDRQAFERRVAELADVIARDPGADLTVRSVRALLAETGPDPARCGPLDGGVLALTGTMLRFAAPNVVDRLEAALAERIPALVQDPPLASALDRASGLLRDVGLSTEHNRAVAQVAEVIADRRYKRLTVAVFDLLSLRLAGEAVSPQVRIVPAPTVLPLTFAIPMAPDSALCVGFDDAVGGAEVVARPGDVPREIRPASAPVLLAASALTAVHELVEAKRAWLQGRPLVTPDSRDLVRFPGSRHMADLMASGGER